MGVKLAPYLEGLFSAFVVLQRITKYFLAKKRSTITILKALWPSTVDYDWFLDPYVRPQLVGRKAQECSKAGKMVCPMLEHAWDLAVPYQIQVMKTDLHFNTHNFGRNMKHNCPYMTSLAE